MTDGDGEGRKWGRIQVFISSYSPQKSLFSEQPSTVTGIPDYPTYAIRGTTFIVCILTQRLAFELRISDSNFLSRWTLVYSRLLDEHSGFLLLMKLSRGFSCETCHTHRSQASGGSAASISTSLPLLCFSLPSNSSSSSLHLLLPARALRLLPPTAHPSYPLLCCCSLLQDRSSYCATRPSKEGNRVMS